MQLLGCVTRVHHDVDVEVARADQAIVRGSLTARASGAGAAISG